MSHFDICWKKKFHFSDPFLGIFSTLPSTQTIKVIGQIFVLWTGHEKLDYEHAFQPHIYTLRPFPRGGGRQTPAPGFT